MGNPLYRVRASGKGGSGYGRPPLPGEPSKRVKNADGNLIEVVVDAEGKPIIVPGITTVIKVADGQGLIQWSVDQVAAYAVANVESLLNRTMEQGWGFLRFLHKRRPDLSDPLRTAHSGVLDDLAELGTKMHEWIEVDLGVADEFPPAIDSPEMAQMVEAWDAFKFLHDFKVVYSEVTVWHRTLGYAGTFDHLVWIDGVLWLIDVKTSRRIGKSHMMQLSALREADLMYGKVQRTTGEWEWELIDFPKPEKFGFIQVRPDDDRDRDAFAELHEATTEELDIYFTRFKACLTIVECDYELKILAKSGSIASDNEEE